MQISTSNMVFFRWTDGFSHGLAYWFTLLFLRFIPVICFILEGLGSVNFVLHGATWFHRWMFNIIYVKYGFVAKMSLLLRLSSHMEYLYAAQNGWLTKLVGWDFVFPCWWYIQYCCYCYTLVKVYTNGCCERFYGGQLPSLTLCFFYFCCLFVNASFLRFKTWRHASANTKFCSFKEFTWISVLIYFFFLSILTFTRDERYKQ